MYLPICKGVIPTDVVVNDNYVYIHFIKFINLNKLDFQALFIDGMPAIYKIAANLSESQFDFIYLIQLKTVDFSCEEFILN